MTKVWRLARRGLDWRFRGLRLLVICLALGTAALAAIGTLTAGIEAQLVARGSQLLGGDLGADFVGRDATPAEAAALRAAGPTSRNARLSAMVTRSGVSDAALPVALKAVDTDWPLYGRLRLTDGRAVGAPGAGEAWIDPGLADRLSVHPGDRLTLGATSVRVGGIIADQPDRLGDGFGFGPPVIVNLATLDAAQLLSPGALVRWSWRVTVPPGTNPAPLAHALTARFGDAGLAARTRDQASPGLDRFVVRMGEFLELVALAALLVAGIGIANGVTSFLAARRATIATFKVLGASSGTITALFAVQLALASLTGIAFGLAAGLGLTPALAAALHAVLPLAGAVPFAPLALLRAASLAALVALAFAAPPLAAARRIAPMALLRGDIDPPRPDWRIRVLPALPGLTGVALIACGSAAQPAVAAGFLGAALGVFALLAALGLGMTWLAARLPRPRHPVLRLALANLHRPGAATPALVVALGFALGAFVLLSEVETSLDRAITAQVPARAPDYFVLDLPQGALDRFTALVQHLAPGAKLREVPALRGAIVAYGPPSRMIRVADIIHIPESAWSLRGDRGLTFAEDLPEGNRIAAGTWWPHDWHGEPLVSVDAGQAAAIGLKVGDRLTVSVLGVERSARVASLRAVNWESFGFNYVLVFSPNALADVPHTWAATISLPPAHHDAATRRALLRGLVGTAPSASVIEVGSVLGQVRQVLDAVSSAILAAASVAILAGLAVLVGALAAARERRRHDAVLLRVLGASTAQLVTLVLAELAAIAVVVAAVGTLIGSLAAAAIMQWLLDFAFAPAWGAVAAVVLGGIGLVLLAGIASLADVVRTRPANALRAL